MCSSGSLLPELLGKPDENSFGVPDVTEPIRVFVLDHVADELRAAFAEPGERIVDVLHGEHDAKVTESIDRGAAVIGDHRRREESGHLEPAVTVRRTHHGNLDAHVAQSSDAICPVSFDWGAPLELEAKFGEELNGGVDVFYHDADVVHTLDRHDVSLASNARRQPRPLADVGCTPELDGIVYLSASKWHHVIGLDVSLAELESGGGLSEARRTRLRA